MAPRTQTDVVNRAIQTLGTSSDAVYKAVSEVLKRHDTGGGVLLDVGCGTGNLWGFVSEQFEQYLGADVVRHDQFPTDLNFVHVDLDSERVPLPDGEADVVASVETIEHLENPRSFVRELVRLTKPGGWIIVTTPNQLSLLSKLTLLVKNQFNAFQDSCYPAHLTALLEVDLRRIAAECKLSDVRIAYSKRGRIPGLPYHYPRVLSCWMPRAFSDNVILVGRKSPD